LTGVFAVAAWGGADGLIGGNAMQPVIQSIGIVATIAYSGAITFVLLKVIGLVTPIRADVRMEGIGLDVSLHSEEAYSDGEGAILLTEVELNGHTN
jgi:Amt family ammonium transporter